MDWQPIETAPEGERIILCWAAIDDLGAHIELGVRRGESWFNTYDRLYVGTPDYWLALPPAPQDAGERDA